MHLKPVHLCWNNGRYYQWRLNDNGYDCAPLLMEILHLKAISDLWFVDLLVLERIFNWVLGLDLLYACLGFVCLCLASIIKSFIFYYFYFIEQTQCLRKKIQIYFFE